LLWLSEKVISSILLLSVTQEDNCSWEHSLLHPNHYWITLQDIFQLIVGTFSGLSDTSGPSFDRRVAILETLAKYRSCVVMLDLECDDLVNEMFSTFFAVARLVYHKVFYLVIGANVSSL